MLPTPKRPRRTMRETLLSARELAATALPFVAIAVGLIGAAYWVLEPQPPKRVVLATGPDNTAYAAFGERYAKELKRHGIEVVLRPTAGARENVRLLRDPKQDVSLAFAQGGASEAARAVDEDQTGIPLVALGSLFYEPVWIFYRAEAAKRLGPEATLTQLTQLRGWKVNTGARGSGTPGLVRKLLQSNLMEREELVRSSLDETAGVVALLAGDIDATVLVSAPESLMVQMLLQTPGVKLFEFAQAEAYARRHGFLSPVTLARGVADLTRDVPPHDVPMVAAVTSLVAREGTHPALVQLFVQAAQRIHGSGGWVQRAGRFPAAQGAEYPLAREAERWFRSGPPVLQRYLPFWMANLVDRMWVALFSIIAVLIPLARVLPPLYQFRIRSRVFRWYRRLREVEDSMREPGADREALIAELDRLDASAERISVPLSYTDELYALRQNIALVRARLRAAP